MSGASIYTGTQNWRLMTKTEEGVAYRIDITIYINAPTEERVSEIVGILKEKILEVPGIKKLELEVED